MAGCYYVTAVDSFNNESDREINVICVENCPCYKLPNVFTPNGDKANDFFIPYPYRFVDHVDMKIYNRWGAMVWRGADPDIQWDGTDINSKKQLIDGVYFYVCDVYVKTLTGTYKVEPLKGFIRIIREPGQ